MAAYFKRPFKEGGRDVWKLVKVSNKTEIKLKMETMDEFVKMNEYVKKTYPTLSESEKLSLLDRVVRHSHYAIESYVDATIHAAGSEASRVVDTEL